MDADALDDSTESWWDSESLGDLNQQVAHESDESADAYLRESWLSFIMAVLRDARRSAGLSQRASNRQYLDLSTMRIRLSSGSSTT